MTCYGDKVEDANCPKDQYMVVKFATYRGLLGTKTCGLSDDDYSCEVDATCAVKKQCDGLHECNIRVDGNLFSADLCPGLSNYLYFEYQCVNTVKPFNGICSMYGDKYVTTIACKNVLENIFPLIPCLLSPPTVSNVFILTALLCATQK